MCENAYLSIKNPKAARALKRALDPGRRMLASLACDSASLCQQLSASEAGAPPLDQILDPHLYGGKTVCGECDSNQKIASILVCCIANHHYIIIYLKSEDETSFPSDDVRYVD